MKKSKFKRVFVKQNLYRIINEETLRVYRSIHNEVDVMGDKNHADMLKKIKKISDKSFKQADGSYKLFEIYRNKLDKLIEFQKKRRVKVMEWFKKYVDKLEQEEINRFMAYYQDYINLPTLEKLVAEEYSDDIALGLEVVEPEIDILPPVTIEPEEVDDAGEDVEDCEEEEFENEEEEIEDEEPDTDLIADEVEEENEDQNEEESQANLIEKIINS